MQYYTTMNDITDWVRDALEPSDGEHDIEAIAYELARLRNSAHRIAENLFITVDEFEVWDWLNTNYGVE
ncbi:MAG: hypothetical protein QM234_04470 [Acidobacteriota bacterium]|nr:hypothetical protein [Acidobacteriota bacterium]